MSVPADFKYTKTHEWVRLEGDQATIGISDFAVAAIKEIVYLDLPAAGKALTALKPFGAIESVKAVFDLNSPVTGVVTEVNSRLASDFNPLTSDPFVAGWLVKAKVSSRDLSGLLDAKAYEQFCASEHH
jgi:glycine cleavage system H protein